METISKPADEQKEMEKPLNSIVNDQIDYNEKDEALQIDLHGLDIFSKFKHLQEIVRKESALRDLCK